MGDLLESTTQTHTSTPALSVPPPVSGVAPSNPASTTLREARLEQLWEAYRADPGHITRNSLVEAYQSVVVNSVRRMAARLPRMVDQADLLTAANLGLMSAIGRFDPERGVRFESYCEQRVTGAIRDELRAQDWFPRPVRQRVEKQKRVIEQLRSELARQPSDDEIAKEMGMELPEYQEVFGRALPLAPKGAMASDEGDDDLSQVLEVVPDRGSAAPDERLARIEHLRLVTGRLSEQECRIVYLKYWEELPMREIGVLTGLSESRVCKIHARLIDRLRDRFRVDQDEE